MDIDMSALRLLEREKDVPFDVLVQAIETALLLAYQRTPGAIEKARVELDRKTGHVVVWATEIDDEGRDIGEFDDTPSGLKGPSITVSRSHPNLVRRLFELEVPEVADGTVQIVALAREAGQRSKMAVRSTVPGINAKGSCIGPMGNRVRAVMAELQGEKIDIVDYDDDPARFVGYALSPAKVIRVDVVDETARSARVIVPDYQLSLAIGREGQNARLANKLTGWRIDIQPDVPAAAQPN